MWALAGTAQARIAALEATAKGVPAKILFPVVGPTHYQDDFGDPRYQGRHEGNDMMAPWKTPVVAVEGGKVRIYTGSSSAGCMLYLYGASGTTYLYIHLNNDLTPKNDNRGSCKPGIAYAEGLRSGQRVRAGQLVGYVGDSGDANGVGTHLHFELHPNDGGAISPYKWLRRANHVLFPYSPALKREAASAALTLTLSGTVTAVKISEAPPEPSEPTQPAEPTQPPDPASDVPDEDAAGVGIGDLGDGGTDSGDGNGDEPGVAVTLTVKVTRVSLSAGGKYRVTRSVTLEIPAGADVQRVKPSGRQVAAKVGSIRTGDKITATTGRIELTLATQLGKPGTLEAARVVIRG